MSIIGNILWLIFGGILGAVSWFLIGMIYCISIIGIPFGIQAFKIGMVTLFPFGTKVEYNSTTPVGLILNIIWLIFGGIELAIGHLLFAAFLAITIVGLPFAKQHLKLAGLSLMPFGTQISN